MSLILRIPVMSQQWDQLEIDWQQQASPAKLKRPEESWQPLVIQWHGLAKKVASKYHKATDEPFDDLVQIASLGLVKAASRYDSTSPAKFSTFAMPYIRGEIQHELRDRGKSTNKGLKIPRPWREKSGRVEKHLRRGLTLNAALEAVGLTAEQWAEISCAMNLQSVASFDSILRDGESLEEVIGTGEADNSADIDEHLSAALEQLEPIQRIYVQQYYFDGWNYQKIAKFHRVTVETVRAASSEAIEVLRRLLTEVG
jgi:RNA polymerase sigma-B factor